MNLIYNWLTLNHSHKVERIIKPYALVDFQSVLVQLVFVEKEVIEHYVLSQFK
jgi:hypothetical protein